MNLGFVKYEIGIDGEFLVDEIDKVLHQNLHMAARKAAQLLKVAFPVLE